MPNEGLWRYAKPLLELQIHPNRRYKSSGDRIPDEDSDQILATLGGELQGFQNETVDLLKEGLKDAAGSGRTGESGSKLYLYLRELWRATRRNYLGSVQRKRLRIGNSLAIMDQIQASAKKFEIIRAEKKEATDSLIEENQQRGNGDYVIRQSAVTFYSQGNFVGGNVDDLAIRLSSGRGGMHTVWRTLGMYKLKYLGW